VRCVSIENNPVFKLAEGSFWRGIVTVTFEKRLKVKPKRPNRARIRRQKTGESAGKLSRLAVGPRATASDVQYANAH